MSETVDAQRAELAVYMAMDPDGNAWVMFQAAGTSAAMGIPLTGVPLLIEHLQKMVADSADDVAKMRAAIAMGRPMGSA